MNPLLPIIPALILGTVAHLLRKDLKLVHVVVGLFLLLFLYETAIMFNHIFPPCGNVPQDLEVECSTNLSLFIPILEVSLYYTGFFFLFILLGIGIDVLLRKWVKDEWTRAVIGTYITLLLLQLWVEVFPWTLLVPSNFF